MRESFERLSEDASPCIDAGSATALLADTTDLDADGDTSEAIPFDLDLYSRMLGGFVDLGAYETRLLGRPVVLSIERAVRAVLLRWPMSEQNFTVLQAPSVDGPWEPIAAPVFEVEVFSGNSNTKN